jgi:replicative DNA helicase
MSDQGGAERLPPHNRDAERSVLGSILRDNRALDDVVRIINPDNFYLDAHQKIFAAMVELYNDRRRAVDLVILAEHLKEQKLIEDIGGYPYLAGLWDCAPTAANAEYYARIVRDKALARFLIHAGTEILRDAYDQGMPAEELLQDAERKILEIAEKGIKDETTDLHAAMQQAWDRIDARKAQGHKSVSGLATGYHDLDEMTAGLQNGELVIAAARPSVGKTSFALSLARNIITEEKIPVFFVSLEMSRIELAERLLSAQARVESHKIRKGHLSSEDMQRLIVAGDQLGQVGKLFIDDSPGQTMLRIAANARRLKLRENIRLVMIDYLQLIEPENRRDPRHEQVAQISRRLKILARELNIPVLALAQLNRGPEDRTEHRPRVADLRESGSLEQDADVVMLLHRPELYEPAEKEGVVELIIGKQRNGPTGTVTLSFVKQFMSFEEWIVDPGFTV